VEAQEDEQGRRLELTADDFERLASKVYDYLKRRLTVERERHGRTGFSLWS
jgi:hypothetical protein